MRVALLAAVVASGACLPVPAPPDEGPPPPQVTLRGVRLTHFKGGDLIASGTARELTYQRTSSEFAAKDVALHLPGRTGGQRTSPTGPGGTDLIAPVVHGTLGARQAEGEGGVVVRTGSGPSTLLGTGPSTLLGTGLVGKTSRARFDGASSTAAGSDEVQVEGSGYRLSSRGFSIDFPGERFTFENSVTTRFGAPP